MSDVREQRHEKGLSTDSADQTCGSWTNRHGRSCRDHRKKTDELPMSHTPRYSIRSEIQCLWR